MPQLRNPGYLKRNNYYNTKQLIFAACSVTCSYIVTGYYDTIKKMLFWEKETASSILFRLTILDTGKPQSYGRSSVTE